MFGEGRWALREQVNGRHRERQSWGAAGAGWGLCSEGGFLMRGEREGPRHIRETYRTSELEGVLSAVLCNRH